MMPRSVIVIAGGVKVAEFVGRTTSRKAHSPLNEHAVIAAPGVSVVMGEWSDPDVSSICVSGGITMSREVFMPEVGEPIAFQVAESRGVVTCVTELLGPAKRGRR